MLPNKTFPSEELVLLFKTQPITLSKLCLSCLLFTTFIKLVILYFSSTRHIDMDTYVYIFIWISISIYLYSLSFITFYSYTNILVKNSLPSHPSYCFY